MIWILLPAYNEEKSLPPLLPKIDNIMKELAQEYRIVLYDDGSSDSTNDIAREYTEKYPLTVLKHGINRGLGETERDGFEYIAGHAEDTDLIVRMDCDDTHDPVYIKSLMEKLSEGYDVVNTSRFKAGGGQKGFNSYRTFISYCANIFMGILFGIKGVKDYSCGYRMYKAEAIKNAIKVYGNDFIQLKGLGFTSTLEMIVKLKLLGCKFAEVPFVLRYDMKQSASKMLTSLTTTGYFVMALCYYWPFGGWRWRIDEFRKKLNDKNNIE